MRRGLHKVCFMRAGKSTLLYMHNDRRYIADTCSIAFVLFAIKSCINWRRLVYFWLFEKRFCRYAIVIRYNQFAYSSKYGKKTLRKGHVSMKLLITRHFGCSILLSVLRSILWIARYELYNFNKWVMQRESAAYNNTYLQNRVTSEIKNSVFLKWIVRFLSVSSV